MCRCWNAIWKKKHGAPNTKRLSLKWFYSNRSLCCWWCWSFPLLAILLGSRWKIKRVLVLSKTNTLRGFRTVGRPSKWLTTATISRQTPDTENAPIPIVRATQCRRPRRSGTEKAAAWVYRPIINRVVGYPASTTCCLSRDFISIFCCCRLDQLTDDGNRPQSHRQTILYSLTSLFFGFILLIF